MPKFGVQPALAALRAERWSTALAARTIGVPENHLKHVVHGRTYPNAIVREKLPELLGLPLEDLFVPDMLAKTYDGTRAWGVKA
jgi:ribosome-binding protein aMBF1 (putative translation factor)